MSIDETRAHEEAAVDPAFAAIRDILRRSLPPRVAKILERSAPSTVSYCAEAVLRNFARLAGLLGYVKADSEQWGYRRYPGYPINPCHLRDTAEIALGLTAECTVERRVVGHGPWEVVSDADTQ